MDASRFTPSPEGEIGVDEARAAILAAVAPVVTASAPETLPLDDALGRVLADDLVSPIDVPAHDNSAMDGYALAGRDLPRAGEVTLRCIGALHAGAVRGDALKPGDCLRIMTGAPMPPGLDTVVPIERCTVDGEQVHFAASTVRPGDNRRRRGEDLSRGQVALHAGRVLTPADLGLASSLGLTTLGVHRRLRVALFSSGDELRAGGDALEPGAIYDSNRHSLAGALRRLGTEVVDLGLVRDDPAALRAALAAGTERADVVVTSGGVSLGDADHTRRVLAEAGEVVFWKVAMRPGRPFAFGALRRAGGASTWLFALPGNPVAALVAFHVLARDALRVLAGAAPETRPALAVPAAAPIRKRAGRSEFLRAVVEAAPGGGWQARLTGPQGSGVLRSLSEANALIVLGPERGDVAAGEPVPVWLFDGLA